MSLPRIPSLGICMIVRNAAQSIEAAVRSCLPVAAQIVVVDTGSTDGTPTLCTRLGANVFFFLWDNNFAQARNHALQYMHTDWVLALDADETLDASSMQDIEPLLASPHIGGLRVTIRNTLSEHSSGVASTHQYPRLFRRHPAIRYTGAIHEQIGESIAGAGFSIADSPVVLHHHGYASVSPEKIQRNATILRAELSENPDSPWLHYHVGLTEFAAQHNDDAALHLARALQSDALSTEQRELALLRLAQIALGSNNWKEFEKRISFSSSDVHREGLRRYLMAVRAAIAGNYADALTLLSHHAVQASGFIDREQYDALTTACRQQLHS